MQQEPRPTGIPAQLDQVATVTALPTAARWAHPRLAWRRRYWSHLALAAITALAAVLAFWHLRANGLGNSYYAEAVKSMTEGWKAFRYAAVDPAATITVDKPPLALWVQAVSAKLFGYSSLSLLGPSAIAGAVSVAVLGRTVTRLFGTWAGWIAALTLALTPVALIANRSNNTDAILVLLVVLGTWAAVRALESGRWRWAALVAVFFALAFLTKMLAAFLVLPAIALAYLLHGPRRLTVRLAQLGVAAVILIAITFGWMLSVDLTPVSARPKVGGTSANSEFDLAFGYNGLERIFGMGGGDGGRVELGVPPKGQGPGTQVFIGDQQGPGPAQSGGEAITRGTGGNGSPLFGGPAGFSRLLTGLLGVQGSWLLPFAVVGLVSAGLAAGWRRRGIRLAGLIVFGGWTVLVWALFSFAHGIFHPYYISELVPGIAALVGIGAVALTRDALAGGWRSSLPALAIAGTALFEWNLLRSEHALAAWGDALAAIGVALALAVLARPLGARGSAWLRRHDSAVTATAVALGLVALLVAPVAYAGAVITTPACGPIPIAQAPGATGQTCATSAIFEAGPAPVPLTRTPTTSP